MVLDSYLADIKNQIIGAIKNMPDFKSSSDSQTTTIEPLCKALPKYKRDDIIRAIVDMEGVKLIDSPNGALRFPSKNFL
jgi:hypothetical protein